jgi:FdhD protein
MTPDAAVRALPVQRITGTARQSLLDQVAVEMPVALVFNGISQAVMMATPSDLEAFALGFALSEGLLQSRAECYGIELLVQAEGCEVQLQVAASAEMRLKAQRRTLAGRTGCGLCGLDSLRQLDLAPPPLATTRTATTPRPELPSAALARAFAQLPARQPLNAQTGAHHAAAWATPEGELLMVMEDVGRHNALDKLLGQRLLDGQPFGDDSGFVIMSSRASYELVMKCARLGVPALATISAPTTLAVDIANQTGLQLYGFCRGEQAVLYTVF